MRRLEISRIGRPADVKSAEFRRRLAARGDAHRSAVGNAAVLQKRQTAGRHADVAAVLHVRFDAVDQLFVAGGRRRQQHQAGCRELLHRVGRNAAHTEKIIHMVFPAGIRRDVNRQTGRRIQLCHGLGQLLQPCAQRRNGFLIGFRTQRPAEQRHFLRRRQHGHFCLFEVDIHAACALDGIKPPAAVVVGRDVFQVADQGIRGIARVAEQRIRGVARLRSGVNFIKHLRLLGQVIAEPCIRFVPCRVFQRQSDVRIDAARRRDDMLAGKIRHQRRPEFPPAAAAFGGAAARTGTVGRKGVVNDDLVKFGCGKRHAFVEHGCRRRVGEADHAAGFGIAGRRRHHAGCGADAVRREEVAGQKNLFVVRAVSAEKFNVNLGQAQVLLQESQLRFDLGEVVRVGEPALDFPARHINRKVHVFVTVHWYTPSLPRFLRPGDIISFVCMIP